MSKENIAAQGEGELMKFMEDMKKESQNMMKDLEEIDTRLVHLKELIEKENADKEKIIDLINSIRIRIGVLEKEDVREMNEEEIAESLLKKLKKWVDQVV
ncbi:hypothetical protein KY348_04250 [Candidatus Woesearchaeota archaeon]|nr:hypothetical protein [Candidatus Woesearchaeota archaeon]